MQFAGGPGRGTHCLNLKHAGKDRVNERAQTQFQLKINCTCAASKSERGRCRKGRLGAWPDPRSCRVGPGHYTKPRVLGQSSGPTLLLLSGIPQASEAPPDVLLSQPWQGRRPPRHARTSLLWSWRKPENPGLLHQGPSPCISFTSLCVNRPSSRPLGEDASYPSLSPLPGQEGLKQLSLLSPVSPRRRSSRSSTLATPKHLLPWGP